jgi:N-methylhydantoinase B
LGYRRVFRLLSSSASMQLNVDRHHCAPWGLHGGREARSNRAYIQTDPDSGWELVLKRDGIKLAPGARVMLVGGGGGGWGDPLARTPEAVLGDVKAGYVSADAALNDYGVSVDLATGSAIRVRQVEKKEHPS